MESPRLRQLVSQAAVASTTGLVDRVALLQLLRARHRTLHYGCGIGTTTAELAAIFDEAIGIDASPVNIEDAWIIAGGRQNLRYLSGDVSDVPALGRFDLVLADLSPESAGRHDVPGTIGSLLDALRPGAPLAIRFASRAEDRFGRWPLRRHVSSRVVLDAVRGTGARVAWCGTDECGRQLLFATRQSHLRLLGGE